MSDQSRDEQVKRLAEVLAASPSQPSAEHYARLATTLYDAGARLPEPPRPVMSCVSQRAIDAACEAECRNYTTSSWLRDEERTKAALRAAWPIMARDTFAALPRDKDGFIRFGAGRYSGREVEAILAALTGEART